MRSIHAVLVLTFLVGNLSAQESGRSSIHDGLNLFSKDAVAKAERQIQEIQADSGIALVVETVKETPEQARGQRPSVWMFTRRWRRAEILDDWARERADEFLDRKNPGIYVVVFDTQPGKEARLVVWPRDLGLKVFWNRQRDMRNAFESALKTEPDAALEILVANYREQMALVKEHPVPLRTVPALFVIASLLAFWLLVLAIRWRALTRIRNEDPEPVAIYQPAMMATLFGVPAAFWINDELFRVIPPEVTPVERSAESDSFTLPPEPPPLSSEALSERPPTA